MVSKYLSKVIVLDPAHGRGDPGIIGHFGIKESGINASIAAKVAEKLIDAGIYAYAAHKKGNRPEEAPSLLLVIHTNNINPKTRIFCNKAGVRLAEKLGYRLDSFPQAGSYQVEIISRRFELVDYPFVLIDIGGVNPSERGLVLCPFDRTFWVLAISEGIKDYLEEEV